MAEGQYDPETAATDGAAAAADETGARWEQVPGLPDGWMSDANYGGMRLRSPSKSINYTHAMREGDDGLQQLEELEVMYRAIKTELTAMAQLATKKLLTQAFASMSDNHNQGGGTDG